MKTKILKSVLSFTLALALIFGSGIPMGNHRELHPQCDWDSVHEMQ